MHQAEALALCFEADLRQERAQVSLVLLSRLGSGPEERLLPAGFLLRVLIRTPAVIPIEPDPVVVVAHDGGDAALADEVDRLVRLGAIADQVSQVIDRIRRLSIDRRQDCFGRSAIAMQIREDGNAGRHDTLLPLITVAGAGPDTGAYPSQGQEGHECRDVAPAQALYRLADARVEHEGRQPAVPALLL